MVTKAVGNILRYKVLHTSLEEFRPMRDCNRSFVLLNMHLCAFLLPCACTQMQVGELDNFKLS